MKKYILYLEFILICAFLVIPPFLAKPVDIQNFNFSLSFSTIICLFSGLYIYYKYEFQNLEGRIKNTLDLLLKAGSSFLNFGFLISVHVIFLILSFFLKIPETHINFDFSFFTLTFALINFLISAFYEENLYRLYLPRILNDFAVKFYETYFYNCSETVKKRYSLILRVFIELVCVNIFAFSHIYLGWVSVINAFICGILLRVCYLRNKSVLPGTFSHFLYNSFIFLQVIL